jgi:hypothetical protein
LAAAAGRCGDVDAQFRAPRRGQRALGKVWDGAARAPQRVPQVLKA